MLCVDHRVQLSDAIDRADAALTDIAREHLGHVRVLIDDYQRSLFRAHRARRHAHQILLLPQAHARQGQAKVKAAALPLCAFHPHGSTMQANEFAAQRQAQASPAPATPAHVGLRELVKDVR